MDNNSHEQTVLSQESPLTVEKAREILKALSHQELKATAWNLYQAEVTSRHWRLAVMGLLIPGMAAEVDNHLLVAIQEPNEGPYPGLPPDHLGAGRTAALEALRALQRGRPTQSAAMILSEVCMKLGLSLAEEDCAHPAMGPDGHCPDCGREPAEVDQ